jgi:CyaY protein
MGDKMDEREFNRLADAMLARLESLVEESGVDVDLELKPGGVIEIECANGSKIIVNRHTAAREIWIAARSGGFHFRPDGERWVASRDGEELVAALARCLTEQTGAAVTLS